MSWSDTDWQRMDEKLDRLVVAFAEFAHIQPQVDEMKREFKSLEQANNEIRRELDKWVQRSVGVWAVAASVIAVATAFGPFLKG